MPGEPISERAARHVAAFNDSVRSGEWADFAGRFTPDATMCFVGIPVGPFTGREAIAAGYASQPPSDTLTVTRGVSSGEVDELWFAWDTERGLGAVEQIGFGPVVVIQAMPSQPPSPRDNFYVSGK